LAGTPSCMPPRALSTFDNAMASGGTVLASGTPAVVSAAMYFDSAPDKDSIERAVHERLLPFDVMSGRPEQGHWQPTPEFSMSSHLFYHDVDGENDLNSFIEANAAEPLRNKAHGPWWEIHSVRTRNPKARDMIFFRIEHACGDGIALMQMLSALATLEGGKEMPTTEYSRPPQPKANPCALLCDFLSKFCKYATVALGRFDTQLPIHPPLAARQAGLKFSSQRRFVLVPEHPLSVIKAIKNAAGVGTTVNDIVYAAFAGALRRLCLESTLTVPLDAQTQVRALVPLAFPRSADMPMINDWTFVSVGLPVEQAEPAGRVAATHEAFTSLKNSMEPIASRLAVQINSCAPAAVIGTVAQQLMSRHSVVFSNVPGPTHPVYLAGQRVLSIYPIFPNLILQALCLSYNEMMYMSFACDERVPEPEKLAVLYLDELRLLGETYGVSGMELPMLSLAPTCDVPPDPRSNATVNPKSKMELM